MQSVSRKKAGLPEGITLTAERLLRLSKQMKEDGRKREAVSNGFNVDTRDAFFSFELPFSLPTDLLFSFYA